ncbi:tether containing UBX domain for GLUT4 [Acyrthosiphon pisum]|uniref:UBX domain-containing protein n=1 Tax=Acyrthosiphon pisum TaxID=7029 RepID=A0A8R2JPM8_ACYPI|nr:tether containing UBX domain for GLUT4 [Acyrthosiphon pisum]
MDIEPNTDKAEESEPINMSTCQKNFDNDPKALDNEKKPTLTNEDLINFKKSISYLDERDTLLFDIMDGTSVLYQDEGDDFFQPTIKDITLVLRDLKNSRAQFEDGQLCTSAMRELEKAQNQLNLLHKYKKCIIRIHFPNRLVLQTIFKSTETVLDIINFIRKYLIDESLDFCLFTTPPKTILKPEDTLLECGCVPSAMIHFSSNMEIDQLKPELKHKIVSGCQASIAAILSEKKEFQTLQIMKLYMMNSQEQVNNQTIRIVKPLFLLNKIKPKQIVGRHLNGLSLYEEKSLTTNCV